MAAETTPTIVAKDLWVGYGTEWVLKGVDLTLTAGQEPVGIIGPSGTGKTTLVNTLLGAIKPQQGTVTYHGHPVAKLGRGDKKKFTGAIRHVSQYGVPTHDPRLTVEKYLGNALKDARKAGRTHPTTIPGLLDFVALSPAFVGRSLITMSGGERQRLALAHALATRPDIILLDEPLTAIDPGLRSEVLRRLKGLAADLGIGILFVSHDLEAVDRLCPTVHILADGNFVASGELSEILNTSDHPVVQDLASAAPHTAQRLR